MILYGEVTTFHKEIIIMSEPLEVMKVSRLIALMPLICHSVLHFLCMPWMQHDLHTLVPSSVSFSLYNSLAQKLKVFIVSHILCVWAVLCPFKGQHMKTLKWAKVGWIYRKLQTIAMLHLFCIPLCFTLSLTLFSSLQFTNLLWWENAMSIKAF